MASSRSSRSLTLSVRYNSSIPKQIQADVEWTVLRLKEEIASAHNVRLENVKLVFQGKEIPENKYIQDLDLGNFTVLDAVKHRGVRSNGPQLEAVVPDFVRGVGSVCLKATAPAAAGDATVSDSSTNDLRRCSYVYCKSQCKDIKPGKLRVRCAKCKKGTLTIERDPRDWKDVMKRNQIHGECELDDCDGEYAEFYFKCAAHPVAEDEVSVVLSQVKTNVARIPCIVCEEAFDAQIVYNCPSRHTICIACFHQYCITGLSNRQFIWTEEHGYNMPCPGYDEGCNTAFVEDGHYFRIMGEEEYNHYQTRSTEEMLINSGGVICPAPNCGAGIFPDTSNNRVTCRPGCGNEFCRLCKEAYHQGACHVSRRASLERIVSRAHVDPEAAARARWMLADMDKIAEITKQCPNCKVPIEKNDGCMHMTCTQCGHNFCWLCMIPWDRSCQEDHWFGDQPT